MVKKEQGQDDFFRVNQQSMIAAYISATDYQRTCVS